MLRENLDVKLIVQVTGLAKEEILKLKNKYLQCISVVAMYLTLDIC